MKCVYKTRSTVVHGGSDADVKKNLESVNFHDMTRACMFLEDNFRETIWWLINIDAKNRPYKKVDGWEDLLWNSKSTKIGTD